MEFSLSIIFLSRNNSVRSYRNNGRSHNVVHLFQKPFPLAWSIGENSRNKVISKHTCGLCNIYFVLVFIVVIGVALLVNNFLRFPS